ncbi:MAG: PQQ-binding-like beta-propeller repeat protein [Proteobacteria bacterium]|nr:PQQ-binding-like beta-propeller repeat protein [Pseudomonadota bacterium]
MKRIGRFLARHLWLVALGAIMAGALIFSGPALAGLEGTQKWAFMPAIGYEIRSSPAIGADGTIYVGSNDKKLYALNPDGTQKWAFATGYQVGSSPAIGADGTIYVGSYDGKLYALNPDGTQKWAFATGGWVMSSPAIGADGTIYVGSLDWKLYAVYSSSPGLANSPWPMFHHDVRHNGRVGYIPQQPPITPIISLLLSD